MRAAKSKREPERRHKNLRRFPLCIHPPRIEGGFARCAAPRAIGDGDGNRDSEALSEESKELEKPRKEAVDRQHSEDDGK